MAAQGISNPPDKSRKRLYTIKEAAVYLGRTDWGLREMIWAGKISVIRDGRRILLDIADMDEWINRNRIKYNY